MSHGSGNDAIFEDVGGFETEDANRFDADVLVGGEIGDGQVRLVGDRAREDVGRAAALMADVYLRDFNLLVGTVEIEVEPAKLADAEFAVDANAGVDFFAGVAVGLEANFGFKDLDLRRGIGDGGIRCWVRGGSCRRRGVSFLGGRRRRFLGWGSQAQSQEQGEGCQGAA